jgi:hypothetical protein
MIGPKKLSTIRQELRRALTSTGGDPILSLEGRMNALERSGSAGDKELELLHGLRRFLEGPGREKERKPRAGSKNRRSSR